MDVLGPGIFHDGPVPGARRRLLSGAKFSGLAVRRFTQAPDGLYRRGRVDGT